MRDIRPEVARMKVGEKMINTQKIAYDSKSQRYYYTGAKQHCSICINDPEDLIYFVLSTTKHESVIKVYCWKCINSRKPLPLSITETITPCIIVKPEDIPKGSRAVFLIPPTLKPTGLSVTEAALNLKEGEVIDNTRLAGKESFEGMKIGHEPTERIAELDTTLKSDKAGLEYLSMLKNSEVTQPVGKILYTDKEQIGTEAKDTKQIESK